MPDIDKILTGKIAHMLRSCAPTKRHETYYCSLCSYSDIVDCEDALEKDISELQKLVDNNADAKLEQLECKKLAAEQQACTEENLQQLSRFVARAKLGR